MCLFGGFEGFWVLDVRYRCCCWSVVVEGVGLLRGFYGFLRMLEKHWTRARKFKSSKALWRRTPPLRLFVTLEFKLTLWRGFSTVVIRNSC
ncbi:hypothetical protein KC19_5G041500 [Ceratodon purpureus]|uniref:Uncharacterized protein n=1 Tax=Ceratodon purpureus TaxID=3225 RepID=A0A8T0HXV0_CERPU|nr:hypothetical protein KC19_5G041500 [Ceratodon purpureus]